MMRWSENHHLRIHQPSSILGIKKGLHTLICIWESHLHITLNAYTEADMCTIDFTSAHYERCWDSALLSVYVWCRVCVLSLCHQCSVLICQKSVPSARRLLGFISCTAHTGEHYTFIQNLKLSQRFVSVLHHQYNEKSPHFK